MNNESMHEQPEENIIPLGEQSERAGNQFDKALVGIEEGDAKENIEKDMAEELALLEVFLHQALSEGSKGSLTSRKGEAALLPGLRSEIEATEQQIKEILIILGEKIKKYHEINLGQEHARIKDLYAKKKQEPNKRNKK